MSLLENSPQIIATQEALRFQLDEIKADLPHYGEVGASRDNGKQSGEYAAILYDSTRFNVIESGTFWFSEMPQKAGSKSWGNKSPRICTWALFKEIGSTHQFYIYNVHLDNWSGKSREKSAALLKQK